MADIVLNDAKGRIAELLKPVAGGAGAGVVVVPLSAQDTDDTIRDAGPDLTTVLALGGTTEQTTSWSRKTIADGSVTITIDDSANDVTLTLPDQTWTGPTASNNVVALLICSDGASDALRYVLTKHEFAVTADGNDVTADFNASTGVWSSA